ncbi:MAG TPA: hypothetical protein VMF91_11695 [Bryobacteraceae bacterium]|nr:hypothetical protein [Bryobacteraceae bacterium]
MERRLENRSDAIFYDKFHLNPARRTKARFVVVGAIKEHPHADQPKTGLKNMRYLLLKATRMAVTNADYVAFQQIKNVA